ncbi:MAG: hypothetical protein ACJ79S_12160 [Gemmatimonadaceae bacterium]
MWGFAWLFWMALIFWMITSRRRRWRRYAMRMGPGWYFDGRVAPFTDGVGGRYPAARPGVGAPPVWRELEEQRGTVDALESRVAELEQRLDFTERLLAERRESRPPVRE